MLSVLTCFFFNEHLLEIIDRFDEQTATQLFDGRSGIPTGCITDNYVFHCTVFSISELKVIISFFNKFKLSNKQTIRLRFSNITLEELKDFFDEHRDSEVIDKLLIDVAFDKSGDLVTIENFDQMRLIIDEVKNTIPSDASNLEIITYVYNWLKRREYKENNENPSLSRRYSSALLTDYIVCVGFTKIFNNILSEYGIRASEYQYHYIFDGEETGHDISIVKVQDKKYRLMDYTFLI